MKDTLKELKRKNMVDITSKIHAYKNYDVYVFDPISYNFVLYKPRGRSIEANRFLSDKVPKALYVSASDKTHQIISKQKRYIKRLKYVLKTDAHESKRLMARVLDISAASPEPGVFDQMKESIELVLQEYLEDSKVVKRLLEVTTKDFSTSIHSVNVMLYCLKYARECRVSYEELKLFGLIGLLHDVGKVRLPNDLLTAPRKLTDQEYEEIKNHSQYSLEILRQNRLNPIIQVAAFQHHERSDGSGYPNRIKSNEIVPEAKALAIADVYEALTNWRPYKTPLPPFNALEIIKKDVLSEKMDEKAFIKFVKSLMRDD